MDSQIAALQERWLWLWASFIIGLVAAWIQWIFSEAHNPRMRTWYERWERWPGRPWIAQSLRMLYAVGLPAAALLWRGALTERGLGFQSLPWRAPGMWSRWLQDLSQAFGIAVGTGILLLLAASQYRHLVGHRRPLRHDGLLALREAVYHEVHWAFYREPFVLLWGVGPGSWAGFLLILVEGVCNPLRWRRLRDPHSKRDLLLRAALAILSTLVFIQTRNLWCALLVDLGISWAAGFTEPKRQAESAESP